MFSIFILNFTVLKVIFALNCGKHFGSALCKLFSSHNGFLVQVLLEISHYVWGIWGLAM
jgi:hypothetical protein